MLPKKKGNYDELRRFEVVIDLRFPYEGVYDEQDMLRGMGIHCVKIPTSSNSPDTKSVLAAENELAAAGTKSVLIHDSDDYRSAMVWAAHSMNTGTPLDAALLQVDEAFLGERPHTGRFS